MVRILYQSFFHLSFSLPGLSQDYLDLILVGGLYE